MACSAGKLLSQFSFGLPVQLTEVLQDLARTCLGININACPKSSATTLVDLSLQGCLCRYTETEGYQQSNKTQISAAVQEVSQMLQVRQYSARLVAIVSYKITACAGRQPPIVCSLWVPYS